MSFDNVAVGSCMGEGLVKCLQDGGKTTGQHRLPQRLADRQQRHAVQARATTSVAQRTRGYTVVGDQAVPDWDNTKAGTIFEQIFTADRRQDRRRRSPPTTVSAARRSPSCKSNGLAGKVPVTGQDATDEGLQRVLARHPVHDGLQGRQEGGRRGRRRSPSRSPRATDAADALATGTVEDTDGEHARSRRSCSSRRRSTKDNVKDVIDDGFTTGEKVCTTATLQQAVRRGRRLLITSGQSPIRRPGSAQRDPGVRTRPTRRDEFRPR